MPAPQTPKDYQGFEENFKEMVIDVFRVTKLCIHETRVGSKIGMSNINL